jgi:hypothetical protein
MGLGLLVVLPTAHEPRSVIYVGSLCAYLTSDRLTNETCFLSPGFPIAPSVRTNKPESRKPNPPVITLPSLRMYVRTATSPARPQKPNATVLGPPSPFSGPLVCETAVLPVFSLSAYCPVVVQCSGRRRGPDAHPMRYAGVRLFFPIATL